MSIRDVSSLRDRRGGRRDLLSGADGDTGRGCLRGLSLRAGATPRQPEADLRSSRRRWLVDGRRVRDDRRLAGAVSAADWSAGEEALAEAVEVDVDGVRAGVFGAEHLAAIALQTGRAKNKARLLQFIEEGALDPSRFQAIVHRHGLVEAWARFERQFLPDTL